MDVFFCLLDWPVFFCVCASFQGTQSIGWKGWEAVFFGVFFRGRQCFGVCFGRGKRSAAQRSPRSPPGYVLVATAVERAVLLLIGFALGPHINRVPGIKYFFFFFWPSCGVCRGKRCVMFCFGVGVSRPRGPRPGGDKLTYSPGTDGQMASKLW